MHAQVRYAVVCVCVRVQLLKDQCKSFYIGFYSNVFLDFNSWILQNNASFSSYAYFCLLGMPLQPFQKSA